MSETDSIAKVKARLGKRPVSEETLAEDIGATMMGESLVVPKKTPPAIVSEPELELEDVPFDFAEDFQTKIAALIIRDERFYRRIDGLVKPEHFENHAEGVLVGLAIKHFQEYEQLPTMESGVWGEILKDAIKKRLIKDEERSDIVTKFRQIKKHSISGASFVVDKVAEFAKNQELSKVIHRSIDFLQKGDFDSIEQAFSKAMAVGIARDYEEIDYWANIDERTQRRKDRLSGLIKPNGIPTGIKKLDNLLHHKGLGRKELTVIMGGAKKGKCVTRDTILLTEHGMIEIGDYVPETLPVDRFVEHRMQILGRDGIEHTSHIYNNGMSDTLKITTNKGYHIEGTYNHPMLVMGEDGEHVWRNLEDVKHGDHLVVQRGWQIFGKNIDISYASKNVESLRSKKTKLPEVLSVELAEWLGMVVAEAHLSSSRPSVCFTQKAPVIVERYMFLTELLFGVIPSKSVSIGGTSCYFERTEVQRFLINLGVKWVKSSEKTIPCCIKTAPKEIFTAFLSPLIGLECHARKWSEHKVDVDLTMASKRLIREIQVALTNYGIVSNVSLKKSRATNGKNIERDYWRIKISGASNISLLKQIGLYEKRKNDLIQSIEPSASTERNWIPNSRITIAEAMNEYRAGGLPLKHLGSLYDQLRAIKRGENSDNRSRVLTYNLAKKFVAKLDEHKINGVASDRLREILNLNYSYEPIVSIEVGHAETVDFTVPDTHSFFANGLVSHNSMGLGDMGMRFSLQGYNVLYATLEVSKDIVAERLDANVTKTPMQELDEHVHSVQDDVRLKKSGAGEFIIAEFPSGTLTCRELKRVVERYRADGIKFDVIITDYADIMAPDIYTQNDIENSKQIWLGLRAIAQVENCVMLTATQTNRSGFKAVTAKADDVAEDFNKIRIADLVFSINRTDEERERGEARLYFAASRNQSGEFSLTVKQDLSRMSFIDGVISIS